WDRTSRPSRRSVVAAAPRRSAVGVGGVPALLVEAAVVGPTGEPGQAEQDHQEDEDADADRRGADALAGVRAGLGEDHELIDHGCEGLSTGDLVIIPQGRYRSAS